MNTPFDLVIVGGGINGVGIARDAAGRGLKVLLVEKGDLASATSSASTKLIHGGLRYLETFQFSLVREALREREVLLKAAPHLITPARFVLPHKKGLRPAWLLRLGLWMYDHMGGRGQLPKSHALDLKSHLFGRPLKAEFSTGFEYSDCFADDARLVIVNALDARARGASVLVGWEVVEGARAKQFWRLTVRNGTTGKTGVVTARVLVNATGPWAGAFLNRMPGAGPIGTTVRPVRGSHILVRRIYDHNRCYVFQNTDNRVIFAIPYHGEFTLIGTTETGHDGDPGAARVSPSEIEYLCNAVSSYFKTPVAPEHVLFTWSGVRPLLDDGAKHSYQASRGYRLDIDNPDNFAPALTVFGGKLTTYRRLAEHALDLLAPFLDLKHGPWTAGTALPGGGFEPDARDEELDVLACQYPGLARSLTRRLFGCYGRWSSHVIGNAHSEDDLGIHFGNGLYQREVEYLMAREWARTAEDVLWRRTKLGLWMTQEQTDTLDGWMRTSRESPKNPGTEDTNAHSS